MVRIRLDMGSMDGNASSIRDGTQDALDKRSDAFRVMNRPGTRDDVPIAAIHQEDTLPWKQSSSAAPHLVGWLCGGKRAEKGKRCALLPGQ